MKQMEQEYRDKDNEEAVRIVRYMLTTELTSEELHPYFLMLRELIPPLDLIHFNKAWNKMAKDGLVKTPRQLLDFK